MCQLFTSPFHNFSIIMMPLVSLVCYKKQKRGGCPLPLIFFVLSRTKNDQGAMPLIFVLLLWTWNQQGVQLVNTMIRQQGNNAYCPRVLLPGCNKKTQKQGGKKKHVHTQTTGATTKQKRKHKREKKAYFSMKSVVKKAQKKKKKSDA